MKRDRKKVEEQKLNDEELLISEIQNETSGKFDSKQIAFALMYTNPDDRRTKTQKINELGVARSTVYRWLKDKEYTDFLRSLVERYTDSSLPEAWNALMQNVRKGDTQAIKLYFELKGDYRQKVDIDCKANVEHKFEYMSNEELDKEIDKLKGGEE